MSAPQHVGQYRHQWAVVCMWDEDDGVPFKERELRRCPKCGLYQIKYRKAGPIMKATWNFHEEPDWKNRALYEKIGMKHLPGCI